MQIDAMALTAEAQVEAIVRQAFGVHARADADLARAATSIVRLVAAMVRVKREKQFTILSEYFLTEALFRLSPLFPFTD